MNSPADTASKSLLVRDDTCSFPSREGERNDRDATRMRLQMGATAKRVATNRQKE